MSVVVSLLRAIDRADGEALVMHVGEKPYVVTAGGHAELASKALTIPAMTGMLDQLLPPDSRHALDELGAVEYHLPEQQEAPGARYSIVAARGGDDIWIEVRRRKEEASAPTEVPKVPEATAVLPEVKAVEEVQEVAETPEIQPAPEPQQPLAQPIAVLVAEEFTLETSGPIPVPEQEPLPIPGLETAVVAVPEPEPVAIGAPELVMIDEPEPAPIAQSEPGIVAAPEPEPVMVATPEPVQIADPPAVDLPEPAVLPEPEPVGLVEPTISVTEDLEVEAIDEPVFHVIEEPSAPQALVEESLAPAQHAAHEEPHFQVEPEPQRPQIEPAPIEEEEEPEPAKLHLAAVVPMARLPLRHEAAPRAHARAEGLAHLLQFAAAQGASVLYAGAQAKPSLRVDGEIRVLDHEAVITEAQLEAGLLAILPRDHGGKVGLGEVETCDVPDVGRMQVLSFRDHRGLGAMFKMLPARAVSSEQIGLGAPIHALCTETEGLLLVAGARGSGKSTLTAALVDQINRTRRDHVITVEQQIQFVHENRQSFLSQREARDDDSFAAAVRTALQESPDVLVIDPVTSTEAATFALHAASNGHLVIANVTAPTTAAALGRFVDFFGDERAQARLTIAEHLRGIITQTLLRKTGGGRAAAREVLVNVPSVAAMVADGAFDQLSSVLNGGRRVGMVPLNDALLGLVQSGALDVREAYRKSPDQQELVTLLNRAGVDTTFAERLA